MTRLFVAALAASLILPAAYAEAGYSHRHKHYRHYSHQHYHYGSPMWRAPVFMQRQPGPRWSGPNRCWQDLGYGRYESCDR
jgi:hypothetical protein